MPGPTRRSLLKVDGRLMQQANRALVLNLVRTEGQISRAAIGRATGLSPASVSGIVDHLLREELLREEGTAATGAVGRRPLQLALNASARVAVGIYLDVREVSAATVDLAGAPGTVHRATVPEGAAPGTVLDLAARLAGRALRGVPKERLLGIGMAVPGMVSWPDGVNLFSPNFGWRDVPVRALMEERMRRAVLVDNEVRTLALAEHQYGAARGARTAVFLDAGYGVGGAVILDGALYRGMHGAAGEFGHNTVDPTGPRCGCGNRGCLEVFASASGLVARAAEAIAAGRPSTLARIDPDTAASGARDSAPVDAGEGDAARGSPSAHRMGALDLGAIVRAARDGDPLAAELLDRAATLLGLAVANAIDNWDPELVVLSGPVIRDGGVFDRLVAAEQRSVLETARASVRVAPAALDREVKVIGAATLVIAAHLATPLHNGAARARE